MHTPPPPPPPPPQAFKWIDLDRSGRIDKPELKRALKMWAIPKGAIEQVMDHCDKDGDGISYKEFIDVLARDNARAHVLG